MLGRVFKFMVVLILVAGFLGVGTWFISRWLTANEQIPEGATKVMGWMEEV